MPITVEFNSAKQIGRRVHSYDILHSVGAGHGVVNERYDVYLVQTLLQIIYFVYPPEGVTPPSGMTSFHPNGSYTRDTHLLIAHFKQYMRKNHLPTPRDGKIDPIEGDPNTRTRHGYVRVLSALNNAAADCCHRAQQPQDYNLHIPVSRVGNFELDPVLCLHLQKRRVL